MKEKSNYLKSPNLLPISHGNRKNRNIWFCSHLGRNGNCTCGLCNWWWSNPKFAAGHGDCGDDYRLCCYWNIDDNSWRYWR